MMSNHVEGLHAHHNSQKLCCMCARVIASLCVYVQSARPRFSTNLCMRSLSLQRNSLVCALRKCCVSQGPNYDTYILWNYDLFHFAK